MPSDTATILVPVEVQKLLLDSLGGKIFIIFAVINSLSLMFLWKFMPETKGKSLEMLEKHFEQELS